MRLYSNQPRPLTSSVSSIGPADHRALSFSSAERPDMKRAFDSSATVAAYPPPVRPGSHGSTGAASMSGYSVSAAGQGPGPPAPARRSPVVYPALLSRVAEAFKERIICSERIKDGLVYSDAFDGRDAVDKIAYIIKTSDRNLALLLGRALDAQKFFHDVTYDHRLRDSPVEIYRFKERLSGPFLSSDDLAVPEEHQQLAQHPHAPGSAAARAQAVGEALHHPPAGHTRIPSYGYASSSNSHNPYQPQPPFARPASAAETLGSADDSPLPSGVFTLLTDCYSPTCTRDRLCYSIACPRRLEQQARLNLKREGLSGGLEEVSGALKRSDSVISLGDLRVSVPERGSKSFWVLDEYSTDRGFVLVSPLGKPPSTVRHSRNLELFGFIRCRKTSSTRPLIRRRSVRKLSTRSFTPNEISCETWNTFAT